MKRRTFLTRMASGIIGVSLVNVEWVPTAITSQLPSAGAAFTDPHQITAEFLAEMVRGPLRGWQGQFVPGNYMIGEGLMNSQCNISYKADEVLSRGELKERYITPAANALAKNVIRKEMRAFGALPMPTHEYCEWAVAMDEATGVAVRGLQVWIPYDPIHDTPPYWAHRFDVLGKAA